MKKEAELLEVNSRVYIISYDVILFCLLGVRTSTRWAGPSISSGLVEIVAPVQSSLVCFCESVFLLQLVLVRY